MERNQRLERKSLRVGAAAILGAIALRLAGGFMPEMESERLMAWMILGETGRWAETPMTEASATEPEEIAPTQPVKVCFSQADAGQIRLQQTSAASVDLEALVTSPLEWSLRGQNPRVLILHTHACESYRDSGDYRTEDSMQNMVSVGERVASRLEAAGIGVIHDRTLHDRDSYDGSYDAARQTVSRYLAEYPEICLVLDLHRDAIEDSAGNQLATVVEVNGKAAARLMPVIGTGYAWAENPQWQENLALGLKLYVQLERLAPGICRNVCLRSSRYNQDLSPGMLLWEVGAAGNTHAEALLAADLLADAIIALAEGTA